MSAYSLKPLPPAADLETIPVLRKLAEAHRYLAELKGALGAIPNESILINTLSLQEARDSSEIENIVTTQDEVYKAQLGLDKANPAAKEVTRYADALRTGFSSVRRNLLIPTSLIQEIQAVLEPNKPGFRKVPGTALRNSDTGRVIYTPPQDHEQIKQFMSDLEKFINDDDLCSLDPLVKMALIHVQFESIHPFSDGNGRTGRILNVLYLVARGLLGLPVLYLSRYITRHKPDYYRLLQAVRDSGAWEEYVMYMLSAVAETSRQTLRLVQGIRQLMQEAKQGLRRDLPKIYSHGLLNSLFRHVYTKIEFVQNDLGVSRLTAARYLEALVTAGYLDKHKAGRNNYYINRKLMALLTAPGDGAHLPPAGQTAT